MTSPAAEPAAAAGVDLGDAVALKDGGVFLVSLRDGRVPLDGGHPLGVFLDDCRHVSGHELRVAGIALRLLSTAATGGDVAIHELTNPELALPGGDVLALQTLRVRVERRLVAPGRLRERIAVSLFGRAPARLELAVAVRADFAAMLAVRGHVELPRAAVAVEPVDGGVRFAATTSDGVARTTTVAATPAPAPAADGVLRFVLALEPGGHEELAIDYAFAPAPESRAAVAQPARLGVDDALAARVVGQAATDLRMLRSSLGGDAYHAAGVPWYATLFGRDSLITALQTVALAPDVAGGTLRVLGARLGHAVDAAREEEPGKVLHELRVGEVEGRTPLARYYGTVDATPLWLCLLAEHARWTGDLDLFRELRGPVEAVLGWLERHGDHDGDGLLDHRAGGPGGLRNQGWKDSADGVVDGRGVPVEPPIALVEAQGYAIRGLRGAAELFARDGDAATAERLRGRAAALAERLERFWIAERGFYGMAVGGEGHVSPALASNQGHLLWAGALDDPARVRAVRDALMGERLFSGWGIRTLGAGEPAYNPLAYHLGSVWPHDTALCADGLRRAGFAEDFLAVTDALLDAAGHVAEHRLPELFAGHPREPGRPPVPYPVACRPQAWAAGAVPFLLVGALGLEPDAFAGRLVLRRPLLPRGIDRLALSGVRVGAGRADLVVVRAAPGAPEAVLDDARVEGPLEVAVA